MTFISLFNFYSAYAPQNFFTFLIFILSFGVVSSRLVGPKVEPAQDCVSIRILKTKIFEKLMMVLNNFIGEQSEACSNVCMDQVTSSFIINYGKLY